jgi:RND family efflux transporter MFP subunit
MFAHTRFEWLMLGVLVVPAAVGCQEASNVAPPAAPKVTVSHPEAQTLVDEDDYNGWLQATQTVDVRARVRGNILKICFQDGDVVKKGQLLFELDPRPFQAAIDQGLAQAKALESQKVAAEKEVARNARLIEASAVSQQEYEKSQADAESYVAQIAAKMQEVAGNELNLEFSRVTAAIDGRIGRALLTEGNLVNAGGSDPVLTTIVAVDPMYVYFPIDERSLQRYQGIQRTRADDKRPESVRQMKVPFRFGLDADEGFPREGVLDFANNKVDQSTGTIEARGVVPNSDRLLVPGSRVRVRIPFSDPYQALLVPDTAILSDQNEKYLLVLGKDNVVLRRDVVLGKLLEDGLRVVRPADPKDENIGTDTWVITLGLQRARVNYPVEPLDSDGQPIGKTPSGKEPSAKASS